MDKHMYFNNKAVLNGIYEGGFLMKRLTITFIILLTFYVIYFDLNHGTLSFNQEPATEVQASPTNSLFYFKQEVKSGDTVLTIVEEHSTNPSSVSIDKLISDFKTLNNGLLPEDIQIGRSYFFPDYSTTR
jgi:hypothetical protein